MLVGMLTSNICRDASAAEAHCFARIRRMGSNDPLLVRLKLELLVPAQKIDEPDVCQRPVALLRQVALFSTLPRSRGHDER